MKRSDGKVMKHLSAAFITTDKGHVKNLKATSEDKHPTVLVVGNRFMNGEFVPADGLEKVYQKWDGKYHNLNHGKNFDGKIMIQEIVGVYTNSRFADNKVMVDIIEGEKTENYDAWKGFLALNDKAGRPTNVSMESWANEKTVKFSEIKDVVDKDDKYVSKANLTDDSDVTVLCDFEPAGGATVDLGAGGDDCSHMIKSEELPITNSNYSISTGNTVGYQYSITSQTNPITVTVETTKIEDEKDNGKKSMDLPTMKIKIDTSEVDDAIKKLDKLREEDKKEGEKNMVEEQKPIEQPKVVETEKPNEEMVTLKKQLEELKKALTEMQAKPVITRSDSNGNEEWVGIKAINKLKQNIKTKRE